MERIKPVAKIIAVSIGAGLLGFTIATVYLYSIRGGGAQAWERAYWPFTFGNVISAYFYGFIFPIPAIIGGGLGRVLNKSSFTLTILGGLVFSGLATYVLYAFGA